MNSTSPAELFRKYLKAKKRVPDKETLHTKMMEAKIFELEQSLETALIALRYMNDRYHDIVSEEALEEISRHH